MTTPTVRFGFSFTTSHPVQADPQQCVRDLLERVAVAREAGFHSVWVGDHHVTPHHYLQNIPMIARIAAVSGQMQIGALFMLPLFQPIILAEQVATLDVICEGRFTLITAVGGQQEAHAALNIPWKERAPRFDAVVYSLNGRESAALFFIRGVLALSTEGVGRSVEGIGE